LFSNKFQLGVYNKKVKKEEEEEEEWGLEKYATL
jgi:hypothetical protein